MDALRDPLMQDDMGTTFIAAFREAVRTDGQEQNAEQRRMEAELRKVREDLDALDAAAGRGRLTDRLHRLMVELEGDLVELLSLGLSPHAPKAGATGAAGLRERVRSVMVGCGGRI
ncbi:hypothetical protein [Azospirillum sp. TSO35-2]|uniref:hypothetical protein n=1 Tax=Azospirillum sp. TSO35-2 TaxID=716796 RepID=UPI000D654112|nr:hypothetical protein [Azospirillum sp. TSO35-2]